MTRPDPYSLSPYLLADAGVMRDIADALDGRWRPEVEPDLARRARLLAAARLRLYGDTDRSGWRLGSYEEAIDAGLAHGDANWSVGLVADVSNFSDSPGADDLEGLMRMYSQGGLDAEQRRALALAVLYEPIATLLTAEPRRYRHARDFDLPERLQILTPYDVVDALGLVAGETPVLAPPRGSALGSMDPWWVPV